MLGRLSLDLGRWAPWMVRVVGTAAAAWLFAFASPVGASSPAPWSGLFADSPPAVSLAEVVREIPAYADPKLSAYLERVGQKIAAAVHRDPKAAAKVANPGPIRVTVLDTATRTAFALTPGQVFIDRGLLLHLNSEAELAAIVALEVARLRFPGDAGWLASAGLTGQGDEFDPGAVLDGLAELISPLARMVRASNDAVAPRREPLRPAAEAIAQARADRGVKAELATVTRAVALLLHAGYRPEALSLALDALQHAAQRTSPGASHEDVVREHHALVIFDAGPSGETAGEGPKSVNTLAQAIQAGRKLAGDAARRTDLILDREGYLAAIEGVVVGPSAIEGVVRDGQMVHRGLAVSMGCPDGWQLSNRSAEVRCTSPQQDAAVQIFVLGSNAPRLDDRLQDAVGTRPLRDPSWHYLDSGVEFRAKAMAQTAFGPQEVPFLVTERAGTTFAMLLAARADPGRLGLPLHRQALSEVAANLRPLAPNSGLSTQPLRLSVVRADGNQSIAELSSAAGADPHLVSSLNRATPQGRPAAGSLVKVPL